MAKLIEHGGTTWIKVDEKFLERYCVTHFLQWEYDKYLNIFEYINLQCQSASAVRYFDKWGTEQKPIFLVTLTQPVDDGQSLHFLVNHKASLEAQLMYDSEGDFTGDTELLAAIPIVVE